MHWSPRRLAVIVALVVTGACTASVGDDLDPEPPAAASAGAAGVGDSLYPGLGNGGYDVTRYDLILRWFDDDGRIEAKTEIAAVATADLKSFNLDFVGLTVDAITVDGVTATFTRVGPEMTVVPATSIAAGAPFLATVTYHGLPGPVHHGVASPVAGWTRIDGGVFVAGEPTGASGWYPVNDHPSDRAAYRFALTVPDGIEAVANGHHVGTEANADGTTTWIYEATAPMASYLVTLAIDDLVFVDQGTVDGVVLRHAFDEAVADAAVADTEALPEILSLFGATFGPYPFETYGHLVVDARFSAALETQTLSVFASDTISGDGRASNVVVHELAHQWFGNHVGLADWGDIWLNEGFATYAEWLWSEAQGGPSADEIAQSLAGVGAILDPPPGRPRPEGLFEPTVYVRGALTLAALRRAVGDDTFFAIVREWVHRFGGATATTADFVALAGEIADRDLGALFDAWLFEPGLPALGD